MNKLSAKFIYKTMTKNGKQFSPDILYQNLGLNAFFSFSNLQDQVGLYLYTWSSFNQKIKI